MFLNERKCSFCLTLVPQEQSGDSGEIVSMNIVQTPDCSRLSTHSSLLTGWSIMANVGCVKHLVNQFSNLDIAPLWKYYINDFRFYSVLF